MGTVLFVTLTFTCEANNPRELTINILFDQQLATIIQNGCQK